MTDRPAAARRPVRTAPRRGAARTPGRPTAAPERRYALIKWALLAALVAYAVLVEMAEVEEMAVTGILLLPMGVQPVLTFSVEVVLTGLTWLLRN